MDRREEFPSFASAAESGHFHSTVAPPRRRRTPSETLGGVLLGLVVIAGLVGSLLLGIPALETPDSRGGGPDRPATAESR
ncbi:hypothetical protein GCM10010420_23880 [Streptomyces glaucosporus]|uniref:Secreted protein n=1 Tax=Streptomyces glaucosporus TaxID=284044 RepID=A0ABN3I945_9ACTN